MLSSLLIVLFVLAVISALRTRIYTAHWWDFHPTREVGMVVALLIVLAFTAGLIDF